LVGILCALLWSLPGHAAEYFYDDLSRLVGVVDGQGNAVQYQYDAVGNRLAVLSYPAGSLAVVAA